MSVTSARRAFLASEWRDVTVVDSVVTAAHPLAPQLQSDTLYTTASDALAEAARRGVLRASNWALYELVVEWNDATNAIDINNVIALASPRFGLSVVGDPDATAAVSFRVLDERPDAAAKQITLVVWGPASGYFNIIGDDGAYLLGDDGAYIIGTLTGT